MKVFQVKVLLIHHHPQLADTGQKLHSEYRAFL